MKLIQKLDGDGFTRVSSMKGLGDEEHYEWKNENSELVYEQTHNIYRKTDRNGLDQPEQNKYLDKECRKVSQYGRLTRLRGLKSFQYR